MAALAGSAAKTVATIFGAAASAKGAHDSAKSARVQAKAALATKPIMPDIEEIKQSRRKSEASRVGSGRASTIFSQPNSGSLGPT